MRDTKALTRVFQAKNFSSKLREIRWPSAAVQLHSSSCKRLWNPADGCLSRSEEEPADRVHLKLTDSIPMHRIKIDMASKTLKHDEDADDFKPDDATSPDPKTLKIIPEKKLTSFWQWLLSVMWRAITNTDADKHSSNNSSRTTEGTPQRYILPHPVRCEEFMPSAANETG